MLELVSPTPELLPAWADCHAEWGPGLHEDGFGIAADDDVVSRSGQLRWLARLGADPGAAWWILDDGVVLGGIALRAADDPRVPTMGHVGYGIRPSARGRGVASWALGEVLRRAADAGIDPVLAVCRDDNAGSRATLERNGAILTRTEQRGTTLLRHYELRARRGE